jgi:low temperature requirement protein LtrA
MELFFDLVYVFAFTQLTSFLYAHLTFRGVLEGLILFAAVWWAWNYTAWATNWIDPESTPGALLMIALMAISLVMSGSITHAFGSRAVAFAFAYVALQCVRSAFMVWVFPRGHPMRRNYEQLLAWSAIAGVVWIAGAFLHGDARLTTWLIAVVVDLSAPLHGFWLPGRGATPMRDWTLAGEHLAERCRLVLMIAVGESVLRVGENFAVEPGSVAFIAAFIVGFITTTALWAMYFLQHAERGATALGAAAADAARVGRAGYAYAHAMMVAGVIVVAVAILVTCSLPDRPVSVASGAAMLGGPALYLAGLVLFRRTVGRRSIGPLLLGIVGLAMLTAVAALGADRLVLCVCATLVLLLVLVALAVAAAVADRPEPTAG